MKIYLTSYNADMCEGHGPMVPSKAFTTWNLAARWILQGRRSFGGCRHDWKIKEIEVLDEQFFKDIEVEDLERTKREALAKLTLHERKVLGLTK